MFLIFTWSDSSIQGRTCKSKMQRVNKELKGVFKTQYKVENKKIKLFLKC